MGVVAALLAHVFAAPHLEPDDVIGVVDDAHGVGLGVADSQCHLYYLPVAHDDVLVMGEGLPTEPLAPWSREVLLLHDLRRSKTRCLVTHHSL